MSPFLDQANAEGKETTSEDVRAFLLENPGFLEENAVLFDELLLPDAGGEAGVRDFQRYRLAKLQDDFLALKAENEDLMDLLQEHLQRQNRFNAAFLALMDAPDFASTVRVISRDFPALLDQEAVGFVLEAGGWLEHGDYDGLHVVAPGIVGRRLGGRQSVFEEVAHADSDIYGPAACAVRSQALVRIVIKDGLPPGLLALGHRDPLHYATGLATEQVECLAGIVERCLKRWLL